MQRYFTALTRYPQIQHSRDVSKLVVIAQVAMLGSRAGAGHPAVLGPGHCSARLGNVSVSMNNQV